MTNREIATKKREMKKAIAEAEAAMYDAIAVVGDLKRKFVKEFPVSKVYDEEYFEVGRSVERRNGN